MKKNILFIIILQIFELTVNASDMRHKAMLDNRDTITSNITDTICFGGIYIDYGFELEPADTGWNYDTLFLTTEAGDDSIVSLELYVAPVYSMTLYDTTCYGGGYYDFGFSIDSLGLGWNYDTLFLETTLGCDSTVCLELYVAPVYDTTFTDTICFGGIYIGHGFELEPADTGWNYDTLFLETVLGCDSTVCLELYVAPTYDITLYDSICHGEDYHKYNFDTIAPATGMCVMQQELLTTLGCDSIVTMNLFVKEVYDITINDTICFGEDYDGYNFHLVEPEVGTHNEVQTLTTTLGCDSIVSLSLYVAPVPQGIEKTTEIKANAYPNPSNGIVNVEADGIEVINILGATGVVMKSYKFEGESLVTIDISDMPNSVYALEIVTRDGESTKRIIKTH